MKINILDYTNYITNDMPQVRILNCSAPKTEVWIHTIVKQLIQGYLWQRKKGISPKQNNCAPGKIFTKIGEHFYCHIENFSETRKNIKELSTLVFFHIYDLNSFAYKHQQPFICHCNRNLTCGYNFRPNIPIQNKEYKFQILKFLSRSTLQPP